MSEEPNEQAMTPEQQGAIEAPSIHDSKLGAFYADRKLMWRNVTWINFGHFGTAISMTIVEPLMNLRLKAIGVSESGVGLLTSANLWAVSFLVMYFSWKSEEHTSELQSLRHLVCRLL